MKKTLAIVLTVVFVLGLSAVAFADTTKKILEPITSAVTNAVSSDSVSTDKDQKVHDLTTKMEASKLEVTKNEEVTITATTEKHGQFQTDSWTTATRIGETVLNTIGDAYVSTAKFSSETPGTYTIAYKIEMDAGRNDGKFVGQGTITIKVVDPQPTEEKVKEFSIAAAEIGDQDKGNSKQALYIKKLFVTYVSGKTDEVSVNIKIGNIYSKVDRMFDVTYEGVTIQFSAEKVLADNKQPVYPGPEITTPTPEKSKQHEKPQTPVKPEKPAKLLSSSKGY